MCFFLLLFVGIFCVHSVSLQSKKHGLCFWLALFFCCFLFYLFFLFLTFSFTFLSKQSMYVRAKRLKCTAFLYCEPSDKVSSLKDQVIFSLSLALFSFLLSPFSSTNLLLNRLAISSWMTELWPLMESNC